LLESARTPQLPLLLDASLLTIGATINNAVIAVAPPPSPSPADFSRRRVSAVRARFTPPQIQSFLPAGGATGKFTFLRLTTPGSSPDECHYLCQRQRLSLVRRLFYWHNINFHVGSSDMYIFLGTDTNRGASDRSCCAYDKNADTVQNSGRCSMRTTVSLANRRSVVFQRQPAEQAVSFLVGGTQLRRFDIFTRQFDPVPAIDLDACPRSVCPTEGATSRSRIRVTTTASIRRRCKTATINASDASSRGLWVSVLRRGEQRHGVR
jgi:hypothetical protein